jgi:hypothetical protein
MKALAPLHGSPTNGLAPARSSQALPWRSELSFLGFSATVEAPKEEPEVVWVPPASDGHAIEFAIIITSPTCVVSDWPAKRSMKSEFVGSFPLISGEAVWVVHTTIPFKVPGPTRGAARFFKGVNPTELKSGGLRAVVFGSEPDGSRVMYDVPVIAEYNAG